MLSLLPDDVPPAVLGGVVQQRPPQPVPLVRVGPRTEQVARRPVVPASAGGREGGPAAGDGRASVGAGLQKVADDV